MKQVWTKIEKNTCKHWRSENYQGNVGITLVVEKSPGCDVTYGVYEGETQLDGAYICCGGTVAEGKAAARKFADEYISSSLNSSTV